MNNKFSPMTNFVNYENKLTEDLNEVRKRIFISNIDTFQPAQELHAYLVRSIDLIHERLDKLEANRES